MDIPIFDENGQPLEGEPGDTAQAFLNELVGQYPETEKGLRGMCVTSERLAALYHDDSPEIKGMQLDALAGPRGYSGVAFSSVDGTLGDPIKRALGYDLPF